MTENELIDEIRDYVHNIHTAEPFHGFSFRELREVGEHFALPREKRIEELEKENADLKCECKRCVYTDSPCILSDYGKDRNGICAHFKDVFDENAELKNRDCWKSCEYANPKAELIEQHTKDVQNLTKAKEIIKLLLWDLRNRSYNPEKDMARAEEFLGRNK